MKKEFYWIGDINDENLRKIIDEIRKSQKKKNESIRLYVNSGGGSIPDGKAFYDWVRSKKIQLETIGWGEVVSSAILIFLAGQKRKATKNTTFLIHNALTTYRKGAYNPIQNEEISLKSKVESAIFSEIIAKETKITKQEALRLIRGKKHMLLTAKEAKDKGLIDEIIS